jgi:hypothetical protein
LPTEKAKQIATARGRPSGIAITTTVTATINASRMSAMLFLSAKVLCLYTKMLKIRRVTIVIKVNAAAARPT